MSRNLIIFILYIAIITTNTQSKSLVYKSTKENYKLPEPSLPPQNSTNGTLLEYVTQYRPSSPLAILKQSIPAKILTCMTQFNIMKCIKVYILQKLETPPTKRNVAENINVTTDFFSRIVTDTNDDYQLLNDYYYKLSDKELNKRIYLGFKHFFGEREIKIQLTPGIIIKVVASENDLLNMSLTKQLVYKPSTGGVLSSRGRKNKYFKYMMKMGVPAMFLPIALIGSFLPMILPGLKMATLFTGAINNAALVAALMYLARTAALENEHKNTVYYTAGQMH